MVGARLGAEAIASFARPILRGIQTSKATATLFASVALCFERQVSPRIRTARVGTRACVVMDDDISSVAVRTGDDAPFRILTLSHRLTAALSTHRDQRNAETDSAKTI
jgi:hypothetical protein